ncbi:MAG: efflux transporter outer membrane subunit [Mediterranea sp.]|nr:efflux transporter outer membrane subunit [Mediterranea sp.]
MKTKQSHILLALLMGVALLATSCRVGKSYTRPDLHLPDTLAAAQDSASMGDLDWRELYADSTLRRLIDRSLEYNKDLLVAAARIKEMAARKRISTAALLPDINGKITTERELENHGGDAFKRADTHTGQFLVSWEIDLWGRLRWARSAAVADYLQSIEARRALRMTIVSEVAQAYYELVALDTELDIVRQTLQAREEGVRLARIRFAGGLTSETSYRQAQVEMARTATLVPDLERQISLKENDIAFLAGDYPRRIPHARSLSDFSFPDSLPVGMPSALLQRRPDIRQAEQQLIAAHARAKVAYTNMFPRLSLTGGFGTESTDLASFLKSPYAIMDGALLTPVFGWGKNRANWKASKAAFEAETHIYEKSVLEAFKEARNAIVNFNKIKEIHALRTKLEYSAKSAMDLAQLQYINGYINYLDVLDAQRGYFDAQIGLSNAVRDEMIAVVQLYKALGGGWR